MVLFKPASAVKTSSTNVLLPGVNRKFIPLHDPTAKQKSAVRLHTNTSLTPNGEKKKLSKTETFKRISLLALHQSKVIFS